MGNTIIFAPSFSGPSFGGLGGLSGLSFGSSNFFSPVSFGNGFFGQQNSNGIANLPGIRETLFKLGFDALTGNLQGVFQDIASLGQQFSNLAGSNASGFQPLPAQFSPSNGCGGALGANNFGANNLGANNLGENSSAQQCRCGEQQSEEDRINDLLKKLLQMFGPMLQLFGQLLSLMLDSSGNNRSLSSSLDQSRFGSIFV